MAVSLPKIAGLILGIEVFFCFVSYGSSARGWTLCLLICLIAGVGVAVVGLLGTQWAIKFDVLVPFTYRFEPRITGLPGVEKGINPNQVAGSLLWIIPLFVALSFIGIMQFGTKPTVSRRWLAPINLLVWEAGLFVILVFVLCQSRSALLALGIIAIVFLLWLSRRRARWFFSVLLVSGMLIAGFAWRYGTEPSFRDVFGPHGLGGASLALDSFGGRTIVWARALLGIEKYPLTGMGMNTFRYRLNELDPRDPIYAGRDIAHAHNEFLQAALDLGIPGLIAFVGIYVIAFRMLIQVWRRAEEFAEPASAPTFIFFEPRAVRMLALGLGGGLFAHILYGLTDAVALGAKPGILFWMLLGLIAGLHQQQRAKSSWRLKPAGD
jgi:O-antigen ligase